MCTLQVRKEGRCAGKEKEKQRAHNGLLAASYKCRKKCHKHNSSSPEIEKDLRLVTSTHTRAADSVEGAVKRTLTSGATYSSSPRFGRLLEQHSRAEQGEGKHISIFNEQIHPPKVEYPPVIIFKLKGKKRELN